MSEICHGLPAYVLAVGINEYENADYNLRYAVPTRRASPRTSSRGWLLTHAFVTEGLDKGARLQVEKMDEARTAGQ